MDRLKPVDANGDPVAAGDRVKLLEVPDWLLRGLPDDEKLEIVSFVGNETEITEIDDAGYVWLGFGTYQECEDEDRYSGHSFAVEPFRVQLVRKGSTPESKERKE
jgi:hypothetical protein